MARLPASKPTRIRRRPTIRSPSRRVRKPASDPLVAPRGGGYPHDGPITSIVLALGVLLRKSANADFRRALSLSSTEWPIIGILWRSGALGVGEICDRVGRDKAHVSRDLAALMRRGLLCQRRDAADRRRRLVDFTAHAQPLVKDFMALSQRRLAQLTRGLTKAEEQGLRRMLVVMMRNVREM